MTHMPKPEAAAPAVAPLADKTMFATLSLYVASERMSEAFENWTEKTRRSLQERQASTRELSKAIDPLFNDIAIRERNATVDEFLIDLDGAGYVERIRITIPSSIKWETEGQRFDARLGGEVVRDIDARTFWYVHSDGSLSFHISMELRYEHTVADYYALSVLQKLMFPKELQAETSSAEVDICSRSTGIELLDETMVRVRTEIAADEGQCKMHAGGTGGDWASLPFWTFVRNLTGMQIAKLAKEAGLLPKGKELGPGDLWNILVGRDATRFIEVRRLKAPPARSTFLLLDTELFRLLQPNVREQRLRPNSGYDEPLVRGGSGDVTVIEAAALEAATKARSENFENFDFRYYFLAGFFQNIIDFLRQDISELRDGTDAIYPRTKEQEEEALFVRFANGRSLFQVIESSRSLEIGRGYIGTCPYLFLVHLIALYNEFLVRRYEAEVAALQEKLESKDLIPGVGNIEDLLAKISEEQKTGVTLSASAIQKATGPFYRFRHRAFTFYKQHLHANTLRYDTERDVFDELQRIRGIETRLTRCDALVDGADRTIRDLEEDKRYRDQSEARRAEGRLQTVLLVVGVFALFQVLFQAVDAYRALFEGKDGALPKCDLARWLAPHQLCEAITTGDAFSLALIALTAFGTAIVFWMVLGGIAQWRQGPNV